MKRYVLPILAILFSVVVGYSVVSLWRGASLSGGNPSRENLLKAIALTPSNPDPYYKMGILNQWDFGHIDLKESLKYLTKAIARNPLEQQYHLNVGKVLQRTGEEAASQEALEKAIRTFPSGYQGRWIAGNLLLQQGAVEKAISHFTCILRNYPNQSPMVYDVLLKVIRNPDIVLEKIVPGEAICLNHYLLYLYDTGDKESAKKAWSKRVSLQVPASRPETVRHVEFLIAQGELNEASRVWKTRLREEGLTAAPEGDLVTNGGFERKEILGGGFDWKVVKVAGAETDFDRSVAFRGKNSLRIRFDGKENVDFRHVFQFVSLKPDRDYVLTAHMKTKGITTLSGPKMEIRGVGTVPLVASEAMTGDNGWREVVVPFRNPPRSQGVLVMVRREKSDKFDRLISGTLWIDEVQIREKKI